MPLSLPFSFLMPANPLMAISQLMPISLLVAISLLVPARIVAMSQHYDMRGRSRSTLNVSRGMRETWSSHREAAGRQGALLPPSRSHLPLPPSLSSPLLLPLPGGRAEASRVMAKTALGHVCSASMTAVKLPQAAASPPSILQPRAGADAARQFWHSQCTVLPSQLWALG